MRVILARLWRSASDDDLPLRVISQVDLLQRLALLLPQSLLFSGRGFPGASCGFRCVRDCGFRLSEDRQRREKQGEMDYDSKRLHLGVPPLLMMCLFAFTRVVDSNEAASTSSSRKFVIQTSCSRERMKSQQK